MVNKEIDNLCNYCVYVTQKDGTKKYIGDALGFEINRGSKEHMPQLVIRRANYEGNFED